LAFIPESNAEHRAITAHIDVVNRLHDMCRLGGKIIAKPRSSMRHFRAEGQGKEKGEKKQHEG